MSQTVATIHIASTDCFIGEATNPTSYMTLHGAMESGEFAAQALLKALPYPVKKPVKLPVKSKL